MVKRDNIKEILSELLKENRFEIIKKLGEGGFGLTYQVRRNNKNYAAKIIKYNKIEKENEADIIKELRGPNIVKVNTVLKKIVGNNIYYAIIMEEAPFKSLKIFITYMKNDNILDLIYQSPFEIISDNLIKIFSSQLIQGLEILNRNNFCHFDIKPQNILVFENNVYKITDFGEAKNLSDSVKESTLRGSQLFMSPVLYNGLKYNQKDVIHNAYKSDVYSLGYCLIYALTLNLNILNDLREIISMKVIHSMISKNIKKHYSGKMIDLITKMLEFEEIKRFSFHDIQKYIQENYN